MYPPSAEFKITSANRQAVKDWLAAQGFDATRVQSMRDQTLLKAYTDPRYLRALTNRGDYNPAVERTAWPIGTETAKKTNPSSPIATTAQSAEQSLSTHQTVLVPDNSNGRGAGRLGKSANLATNAELNSEPMAEAGLSSAPAGPENTQVVAAAQAGGCCRECSSLTEARVIELIRALAVLKPTGLEGLEDLL